MNLRVFFSETKHFFFVESEVKVIHTQLFQVLILFLLSLPFHLLSPSPTENQD